LLIRRIRLALIRLGQSCFYTLEQSAVILNGQEFIKMTAKSRKRKRIRQPKSIEPGKPHLYLEYYQPIFYPLIQSVIKMGYRTETPHSLRNSFWKLIPYDTLSGDYSREIVAQYARTVEKELSTLISRHSIAYWLHLYRRLSPTPFGPEGDSKTVILNRVTLEAAIQKYGLSQQCDRVGISDQVPEDSILRGALMAPEFGKIRSFLKSAPQLVLTNFGIEELVEFYEVEKLAFELWRCAATLRALAKGATLRVVDDAIAFYEERSDELDKLITSYDERGEEMGVSATGTVYDEWSPSSGILLPVYNVGSIPLHTFNPLLQKFYGCEVTPEMVSNFIWIPFSLGEYLDAHKPFAEAFEKARGVPLSWVIGTLAALAYRVLYTWREMKFQGIIRYFQRAYEGPFERTYVISEIEAFLDAAVQLFRLEIDPIQVNVPLAVHFLELTDKKREMIDVLLGGPLSVFLPLNDDRIFIDYAWYLRILYSLFHGVKLADQNFKGEALEQIVHKGRSVLPTGKCHALNGENRQIDAAFEVDGILLITECRAVGRSLVFDRGDPKAIQYRIDLLDRTLSDVDKKARWLARNPLGRNYDIRKYQYIMPMGVTPFVEYIPSLNDFYWVGNIPRVLTRQELERVLKDETLKDAMMKSPNCVPILSS
jgi:hypothetical protein